MVKKKVRIKKKSKIRQIRNERCKGFELVR